MPWRPILSCPRCQTETLIRPVRLSYAITCQQCRTEVETVAFAAVLEVPPQVPDGLSDGQVACFFHVRKAATIACDSCGRFLCAGCSTKVEQRELCLPCLHALCRSDSEGSPSTDARPTSGLRWDSVATALALSPVLMAFPVTILSGALSNIAPGAGKLAYFVFPLLSLGAIVMAVIKAPSLPRLVVPRSPWRMLAPFCFGLIGLIWGGFLAVSNIFD